MQFAKESDEEAGISLTSLIDVIFLLLIFFMVATTLVDPSRKLDIQLPAAKAASNEKEKIPVTIEMSERGDLTLNGERIEMGTLENRLKILSREGRRMALVRADKRLDYGRVVEILGICRAVGIHEIGIAVK